jgi:carbon dioxide concentrating mechanism protein CcmK
MAIALGMVEVLGVPASLEVADAMVKAAQVTLVGYENTDFGRITVLIRGAVGEVETAVAAGIRAVNRVHTSQTLLLSHHLIPSPHSNLEAALPIYTSDRLWQFADEIRYPAPLSP